jgi:hypothetical protein
MSLPGTETGHALSKWKALQWILTNRGYTKQGSTCGGDSQLNATGFRGLLVERWQDAGAKMMKHAANEVLTQGEQILPGALRLSDLAMFGSAALLLCLMMKCGHLAFRPFVSGV